MSNILEYKGYIGRIEFSAEDKIFHGKLEFINDLVTFEATTVEDLQKEFKSAVDDYLETCKKLSIKPQKSFKGTFNVRVTPELHKEIAFQAVKRNLSLNRLVEAAIRHELSRLESSASL
ncbi:MAG: type II toxin-antitoxin system HicB family antitoxin [Candidatus Aminicenantes bacterium]|nr:type II toxin-antitoxin system HicB family antitoxin [Candidatus Aminicenantes bacterium]